MQTRVLEAPPRNQTILKVFAFSQVRNSLFFWFVLSETAPRRHSATVLELGGLQLHPNTRVCVFIPSQAKLTGTASSPRPLSSITHRSALTCLLRKLEQHGEARTESLADSGGSRLEKQLLDLPHTSVVRSVPALPRGWGAAAFTSLSLLPHLRADRGGVRDSTLEKFHMQPPLNLV